MPRSVSAAKPHPHPAAPIGASNATPARRNRADGDRTRQAILLAAARLATTHGLSGLSIGELAAHLGMSKSGLYAHFKSKEDLELAAIQTAIEIFHAEVLDTIAPSATGLSRLLALVDAFLSHVQRRVFPGGCFFAAVAAELDTHPGPARDRIIEVQNFWESTLTGALREAQAAGQIARGADLPQAYFEIEGMLLAANCAFVMHANPEALRRARLGVENVLRSLGATPAALKAANAPVRRKP